MSKDCVFYFSFYESDPDLPEREVTYGFIIRNLPMPEADLTMSEQFEDKVGELEEYGVHDWSTSPSDEIDGIGYNTYEVERDKEMELMSKWRDFFVVIAGEENVGPVVPVIASCATDYDVYLEILRAK